MTPGTIYNVSSTLTISNNYVILNGNGACILTTAAGDGIQVSGALDTLNDVCLMPGTTSTGAAIHDTSGQFGLTINRPRLVQYSTNLPTTGYYWYYGLQVDADEDFTVNGYNQIYHPAFGQSNAGSYGVLRCDATFCGSGIYNTAGSGMSAVGYINDSVLSMGCYGNSIDWEGGNDLKLNGVILQGYNQFGLKANNSAGGGSGNITAIGVHNEMGNCTNPMLNGVAGGSGYVVNNVTLRMPNGSGGGGGGGLLPNTSGSTAGSENYAYYVVIHQGITSTTTIPLLIGETSAANATLGGGNGVVVISPTSPGSGDTCDFLRVDQSVNGIVAPYSGSGLNYAIPGEQGVACGPSAGTYVTFNDTTPSSSLTSYSFNQYGVYGPAIGQNGWPGAAIVLTGTNTNHGYYQGQCPIAGGLVAPDYAGTFGRTYVTCEGPTEDGWSGNKGGYTPVLLNRQTGYNYTTNAPSATLDPIWYKYTPSGLKGLYNFGVNNSGWQWDGGPTDAFTLIDSNPGKTLATPGNRPTWDAGDTAIGIDAATGGLAFRDPTSISEYIDHVPDNSSYLERLTSSAKIFTVPASAPGLTLNGGTEMTGNHGNGANVQHSTGTTATNDCAKFDANGNVVDAGSACGSGGSLTLTTTGTNGASTYSGGVLNIPVYSSGGGGTTTNYLTFNNGGSGAASGTAFNGASPYTISYNTIGAQPLLTNPVTGPGSGATVGHLAVMGNTSGTSITDGGAVPAALPPNGTASGDLSGSYPGPTVAQIEGAAIPASAPLIGTNGSKQIVAAMAHSMAMLLACSDTSGSGTAQSCATAPSFTPAAGDCVSYSTTTANTGTGLTINVNSLGAKSVAKWQTTTTLAAGDIGANTVVKMCYDGTRWEADTIGNAPSSGGGGGITSINGNTAAAQIINNTDGTVSVNSTATAGTTTVSLAPTTYWMAPFVGTTSASLNNTVVGRIQGWGFIPNQTVTFSNIYMISHTADASNLYSAAIANSSGTLICNPSAATNMPTADTMWTNACSEGSVTLYAGQLYILLTTGSASTGTVNGMAGYTAIFPYFSANITGCTSTSGLMSGTCSISLAESMSFNATPSFSLH